MRDYSVVSPRFWIGETGKRLRKDPDAQRLAFYLMTSPHAHMSGVFHCPILYMAHEVGLTLEGASEALARLSEAGFCQYDEPSETVFVVRMARYQLGDELAATDNRVKGLNRDLKKMPASPMKSAFVAMYAERFHIEDSLVNEAAPDSPSQAPSEPHRSQEQDQDQDQDQDQEQDQEKHSVEPGKPKLDRGRPKPGWTSMAQEVFEHWQTVMGHPQAKFNPSDDRIKKVIQQLKTGYSVSDLCQAVNGCARTPHNMGENDRGQRYDGLNVICKNGDNVDRFMRAASGPDLTSMSSAGRQTAAAAQAWLNEDFHDA